MPRRRLSEQQRQRIERIQQRRRDRLETRTDALLAGLDAAENKDEPREGRVVVRHGASLAVEDADGALWHCQSRQHIGQPVCGDRVVWQPTDLGLAPDLEPTIGGSGIVTALQPRDTVLSRPDYAGRDKPLAANITLLVIVIAPRPPPSGHLLDAYLATAELIGVGALIAVTKTDLFPDTAARDDFLAGLDTYRQIGYPVLALSVHEDPAVPALRAALAGQTAILVGQSGVGKSSLVQALLPDQAIQIGRLSAATGLGRHTTSAATCYRLGADGFLIDSPGVRSFRLGPLGRDQLARGFREFAPFLGHCRFADCSHRHEPDCALRGAVARGAISAARLATFHALAEAGAPSP